jgi:hypothetical protein
MNAAEFGEKTRAYITDHIKFGDTKAGAIVALSSGLAGALVAATKSLSDGLHRASAPVQIVATVFGAAFVTSLVMALWRAIDALMPKTPMSDGSLASFPDIARLPTAEYVARIGALDEQKAAAEYASTNAAISRIAVAKFSAIRKAVWWARLLILAAYGLGIVFVVVSV